MTVDEELLISLTKYGGAITGTVAVFGTITNGISLSYFVKRRQEGLGNRFLVYLNIIDTLVCCIASLMLSSTVLGTIPELVNVFFIYAAVVNGLYRIAVEASCVITTYLCAIRTLSVILPLYRIKKNIIYGTIGLVIAYIPYRPFFYRP